MDDGDRWAEARRRAAALHEPTRSRRDRRILLVILLASLVAGVLSASVDQLLSAASPDPPAAAADPVTPSVLFWVGFALAVAGMLASLVVLLRALVTRRLVIVSARVEAPLSGRQRRRVGRILRGREPPDPVELPVIRAIAEQRVQAFRALVPAYAGLGLFVAGATVAFADLDLRLPLLFGGLGVLAALVVAVDAAVQVRPARRFLLDP